jgi:hypothetical protein
MTRDFDLIRKILLMVEQVGPGEVIQLPEIMEKLPGYQMGTIAYHIDLLSKAGLIEGETHGYPVAAAVIQNLSWAGHDFLAAARSDTIWNKTMAHLAKAGVSGTVEIVKAVLIQFTKGHLGLP